MIYKSEPMMLNQIKNCKHSMWLRKRSCIQIKTIKPKETDNTQKE